MLNRLHNGKPLPKGVYFKHGAYYKVMRNIWVRLGTSPDCIHDAPITLPARMSHDKEMLLKFSYGVLARARQNARGRRKIDFALERVHVHRMLNEAGWRCKVTGAEFTLEIVNSRRPFAPSIDRIDSSKGYTDGNCQIVCAAVNYAMNVWGEAVLWRLFNRKWRVSFRPTEPPLDTVNATS